MNSQRAGLISDSENHLWCSCIYAHRANLPRASTQAAQVSLCVLSWKEGTLEDAGYQGTARALAADPDESLMAGWTQKYQMTTKVRKEAIRQQTLYLIWSKIHQNQVPGCCEHKNETPLPQKWSAQLQTNPGGQVGP